MEERVVVASVCRSALTVIVDKTCSTFYDSTNCSNQANTLFPRLNTYIGHLAERSRVLHFKSRPPLEPESITECRIQHEEEK